MKCERILMSIAVDPNSGDTVGIHFIAAWNLGNGQMKLDAGELIGRYPSRMVVDRLMGALAALADEQNAKKAQKARKTPQGATTPPLDPAVEAMLAQMRERFDRTFGKGSSAEVPPEEL